MSSGRGPDKSDKSDWYNPKDRPGGPTDAEKLALELEARFKKRGKSPSPVERPVGPVSAGSSVGPEHPVGPSSSRSQVGPASSSSPVGPASSGSRPPTPVQASYSIVPAASIGSALPKSRPASPVQASYAVMVSSPRASATFVDSSPPRRFTRRTLFPDARSDSPIPEIRIMLDSSAAQDQRSEFNPAEIAARALGPAGGGGASLGLSMNNNKRPKEVVFTDPQLIAFEKKREQDRLKAAEAAVRKQNYEARKKSRTPIPSPSTSPKTTPVSLLRVLGSSPAASPLMQRGFSDSESSPLSSATRPTRARSLDGPASLDRSASSPARANRPPSPLLPFFDRQNMRSTGRRYIPVEAPFIPKDSSRKMGEPEGNKFGLGPMTPSKTPSTASPHSSPDVKGDNLQVPKPRRSSTSSEDESPPASPLQLSLASPLVSSPPSPLKLEVSENSSFSKYRPGGGGGPASG